ncbi:MAG: 2-oxoacid:acceptor oxidoreductase subunit alpha, partial [Myxococcota bacterium]
EKVARIAQSLPPVETFGPNRGDLLVVGWGSTHGAITSAVESAQQDGLAVSSIHLRHLNPFPSNLGEVLSRFDRVLVPELNAGQLAWLLRARFLVDAVSMTKLKGQPFKVAEIRARIAELVGEGGQA